MHRCSVPMDLVTDNLLKYKVELRIRNHNTHTRDVLIQRIVRCLPEGHRVDLANPEIFILAEVFKVNWHLVLTVSC